jgi:hypothetical protein
MDATVGPERRSLLGTALVRAPLVAIGGCFVAELFPVAGPYAFLAGIPLAPAVTAMHATEHGARPRRTVLLAAVSAVVAVLALLALWVGFFVALELIFGPSDWD